MAYWVKQGWFFQSKIGEHDVPFGIRKLWDSKNGYGEIHLASLIFAVWGAMMVSKTLRVSFQVNGSEDGADWQVPKL
jgi:CDP-diacylglycerol--serine O-phosphatidyltransferase